MGVADKLLVAALALALVEVAVPGVAPYSDLWSIAADHLAPDWNSLL